MSSIINNNSSTIDLSEEDDIEQIKPVQVVELESGMIFKSDNDAEDAMDWAAIYIAEHDVKEYKI